MKLDIGTPVRYADGEQVGLIHKVVIDPQTTTVREVVVEETGDLAAGDVGRMVLLPVSQLRADPGEVLTFTGDRAAAAALPDYSLERFVAPPEDWAPDGNYTYGDVLFPNTMPYDLVPVYEESNTAEGSIELSQGTEVYCSDGRLGVIDQVLIADDGQVVGLVVRPDEADQPLWLVAPDLLASSNSQLVELNCTLAELPDLAEEYSDSGAAEPEDPTLIPST